MFFLPRGLGPVPSPCTFSFTAATGTASTRPTSRSSPALAVGAAEGPEYHRQTNDLAAAWRALGAPVDIVDAAGLDHFSIVAELERPDSALARVIRRQMALA